MKKIQIIYSCISPSITDTQTQVADEDTLESALFLGRQLQQMGYEVKIQEIRPDNISSVSTIRADVVFNMVEWAGRDYMLGVEVIRLLEKSGQVFTGCSSENYIWGSEKLIMKNMFDRYELPTPKWGVYDRGKLFLPRDIKYPVLVKPSMEHCSIGLSEESLVYSREDLEKQAKSAGDEFVQPILVEEFEDGNEYQVFVVERDGKPWVLPPCETVYKKDGTSPLITFKDNWINPDCGKMEKIAAADYTLPFVKEIMAISQETFVKMKCRGYARIDIREKNGRPFILEVNVNPGLGWDEFEDVAVSARAAGLDFSDLLQLILDEAVSRSEQQFSYDTN